MAIAENLLSDAKAPSADAKVIIIAITKIALLRFYCLFILSIGNVEYKQNQTYRNKE